MTAACALACAAVLFSGCSSDGDAGVGTDSAAFAGIDGDVAREVLSNPVSSAKIEEETTESSRASMAQGIALNFIMCRSTAQLYQDWVRTGVAPELPAVPTVDEPQQPAYDDTLLTQERLGDLIASGDPAELLGFLTGESSCGHWIPATPGDVSGPTIEDSLRGAP